MAEWGRGRARRAAGGRAGAGAGSGPGPATPSRTALVTAWARSNGMPRAWVATNACQVKTGPNDGELVDVHDRPEQRSPRRTRSRPAAPAAREERAQEAGAAPREAPRQHLPRRPRALAEEGVRDERRGRADGCAGARSQADARDRCRSWSPAARRGSRRTARAPRRPPRRAWRPAPPRGRRRSSAPSRSGRPARGTAPSRSVSSAGVTAPPPAGRRRSSCTTAPHAAANAAVVRGDQRRRGRLPRGRRSSRASARPAGRVHAARGLVEQQHGGIGGQRRGDRHALPLAGREVARMAVGERGEVEGRQRLADSARAGAGGAPRRATVSQSRNRPGSCGTSASAG